MNPPKKLVLCFLSVSLLAYCGAWLSVLSEPPSVWAQATPAAPKSELPAATPPPIPANPNQPQPGARYTPPVPAPAGTDGRIYGLYTPGQVGEGFIYAQPVEQQRIGGVVKKLREAKDDREKQAAKADLRKVLTEIFTADMQTRENQAKEIEGRLSKLRQQYQARDKVKDQIIDLQVQLLENDAAGLGFPTAPIYGNPNVYAAPNYPPGYVARPKTEIRNGQPVTVYELQKEHGHEATPKAGVIEPPRPVLVPRANIPPGPYAPAPAAPATVAPATVGPVVAVPALPGLPGVPGYPAAPATPANAPAAPGLPGVVTPAAAPLAVPAPSPRTSSAGPVTEYNELRNHFAAAKDQLQRTTAALKESQADYMRRNLNHTEEDFKKHRLQLAAEVDRLEAAWVDAQRMFATKVRLLELDCRAANVALEAAEGKLAVVNELFKKGTVPQGELAAQRAETDHARIQVERAEMIRQLFDSIRNTPNTPAAASPNDDPLRGRPSLNPGSNNKGSDSKSSGSETR